MSPRLLEEKGNRLSPTLLMYVPQLACLDGPRSRFALSVDDDPAAAREIEAAWHHRHRSTLSALEATSRQPARSRLLATGDRTQEGVTARYRCMTGRGTVPLETIVAMACELTGYPQAVLQLAAEASRR
jgi:hypothetical protein